MGDESPAKRRILMRSKTRSVLTVAVDNDSFVGDNERSTVDTNLL
jgi:hypothetical protein